MRLWFSRQAEEEGGGCVWASQTLRNIPTLYLTKTSARRDQCSESLFQVLPCAHLLLGEDCGDRVQFTPRHETLSSELWNPLWSEGLWKPLGSTD
ncbi:hypothetical protein Y1Q_0002468 [Alligator mississippiensis]|uniref:Uncharacterized protein n=1 Tax=Alligator mississippiensis TaxID=8496 RepID=A0A151NBG8_ALLMI|nr:hypothetical protein Y1Q_0002468 [Alligator mississippiensis]